MDNIWIIYNPKSGRGRGRQVAADVETAVRASGRTAVTRATEGPAHAAALVREAVEQGAERLAVVGGDGTVRDAAAGLEGDALPLAIIPAGTGNDLTRSLGIPRQTAGAVEILLTGHPRPVDLWLWNGLPFLNVAGMGLDAAVASAVNTRLRRLRGTLAYLVGVAITLPVFKAVDARLRGDGWEYEGAVMLAAVANAAYYGGGMMIAPGACVDDGLLSIVVIEAAPTFELLRQMPKLFRGTHLTHPKVKVFASSRLEIEAVGTQPVTLDGELLGGVPAVIEKAPWSVSVLVTGPP